MGKDRPKTHNEMQKTVCVACLAPGCVRTVTPGAMTEKVREFVVGDFGPDVESLPQGLCQSCRLKLSRGTLKCSVNYQLLRKRGVFQCFHGQENHCECYICVMGRDTKLKAKPKGAPKPPPVSFTTCAKCFARLQPGHPHDCRLGARVDNILKTLPPDVAQQVASKVVTNEAGDSSTASLMRPKGPRMTVNVGKLPEKPRPLSHQDLLNFKVKYGVRTLDFAHDYRTLHGWGSVDSFWSTFSFVPSITSGMVLAKHGSWPSTPLRTLHGGSPSQSMLFPPHTTARTSRVTLAAGSSSPLTSLKLLSPQPWAPPSSSV